MDLINRQDAIDAIDEALKRVFKEPVGESIINKLPSARPSCSENPNRSDDLIRRADAIKELRLAYPMIPFFKGLREEWAIKTEGYREAEKIISNLPSAEPKRGEWIISEVEFTNYKYQCKECGWYENHAYNDVKPYNFCPNCGADMRKEKSHE